MVDTSTDQTRVDTSTDLKQDASPCVTVYIDFVLAKLKDLAIRLSGNIEANVSVHTFEPISFKIWDNGPPGSVTKILKNETSRLLENALLTIKSMSRQILFPKNNGFMTKLHKC